MTNENNNPTLMNTLYNFGETLTTNLESMGVTDIDNSDGLTYLANKILDIEPSVSGLNLTTSLTCESSDETVYGNNSFTLTSTLTVSYDDTTQENVDLSGVLTGAIIEFYDNDDNLQGQSVTDNTGTASITISSISEETTYYAIFNGTNNFNDCESSTITVEYSQLKVYYDDCSGAYSSLWTTNPSYTTYGGYPCIYNNKALGQLPTNNANVMIEFGLRPTNSWGGLDFGDQSTNFCFFRNSGQTTNDHSAICSPLLSDTWHSVKIIVNNGNVQIWVDNNKQCEFNRDSVSTPLRFWGGSSSYPCYLKEITITEL